MAVQEKKPDSGKTRVQFKASGKIEDGEKCFFTLNRFRGPGKYMPVYKSESKDLLKGLIPWNPLIIDTDTLCDANNA